MSENLQQKSRRKKSSNRRAREAHAYDALVEPNSLANSDDTSRMTSEASVNITQYECELDNDTAALMARHERKKQHHQSRQTKSARPVTPPTNHGTRLERWEEERESQEYSTDEEVETHTSNRFSIQNQLSKRSLISPTPMDHLTDTLSQAPSVISEQYLESIEDLPFDDDSFVPLMGISPVPDGHQGYSGIESEVPREVDARRSSSRRMKGIQESHESDESYPPPVSEIELKIGGEDTSVAAGYQSEKLSQFLKATGQDDQVAAATAQAFEAFLLSQERAMLQLIPEDDICDLNEEASEEEYDDKVERQRRSPDANVYAKLAAVQMGMNKAHHGHQSKSSRSLGRSQNQVYSNRHLRQSRSNKENRQNRRGQLQHQPTSHRNLYDVNESSANQSSNRPYDEDDRSSFRRPRQPPPRLKRQESIRSTRSDRRHLVRDFDHTGRFRQSGAMTAEPSRELRELYHGRKAGHGSIPAEMTLSSRGIGGSLMHTNTSEVANAKPVHSTDSASSSTLSGRTSPLTSVVQCEKTFAEQIEALPIAHRGCYNALKSKWELRSGGKKAFPDELYLRFAMCSPEPFDFKSAWTVMKRFDRRYLNLSITSMESQLRTKTLFPVPGLKSRGGNDMLYFRPSRFFPGKESTDKIIDNLVYVMNTMLEKEQVCADGIGVIMNMTDWKMANFSVKYWHKLMTMLQGRRIPTRVSMLLIVNPPSWFGSIWAIMRPMLSEPFRSNVFRISFHEINTFLANGYERFLPDEMHTGCMKTNQIVRDFIAERKKIEKTAS